MGPTFVFVRVAFIELNHRLDRKSEDDHICWLLPILFNLCYDGFPSLFIILRGFSLVNKSHLTPYFIF